MIPKVLIVDGNNLAHMAYYNNVMYNEGKRTELVFTGLKMIRNLLLTFDPDRVTVVWDGGRDERRKKLYPEYKENRTKVLTENEQKEKEIFFEQISDLIWCITNLGITQFKVKHREADDVIYNLINEIDEKTDGETKFVIASTDKDFLQLISFFDSMVYVYNSVKRKEWHSAVFEIEFGFNVKHYTVYKALVGDKSDNLPGVKGIGDVGAKFLIKELFSKPFVDWLDIPDFTAKEKRALSLFEKNFDMFEKMQKMVWFMDIDEDEIQQGKIPSLVQTKNGLLEKGIIILNKYGFQSLIEKFDSFIQPFSKLNEVGNK